MQHDTSLHPPKYLLKTNALIQLINYWLCVPLNCLFCHRYSYIVQLTERNGDAEATATSAASFRVGLYIFKYIYVHMHLHRHMSERSSKGEVKQVSLNHRNHQREEGRERRQNMPESPAWGWLRDVSWGLWELWGAACLKCVASVWSRPSSPYRSQPLIASLPSVSTFAASPCECSESNLEQPLLEIPFLPRLADKRIYKTHLGLPEPPEELPSCWKHYAVEGHKSPKQSSTVSSSHCTGSSRIPPPRELFS